MGTLPRPLRILAVNRNRILREGISVLIEMQQDLKLVASVEAPEEAVRIFAEKRPDLTLMDLGAPSQDGLDAIQRIRATDPGAWIIALVLYELDDSGTQALEAGAATVLAKDLIGEMLVPMIHAGARDGLCRDTPNFRGMEIPEMS